MAVKDILIQSGVENAAVDRHGVVRGSNGTLYTVYVFTSDSSLRMAYSTDGGSSWSEVSAGAITGIISPTLAIDSMDVVHVAYGRSTSGRIFSYRTFSGTTWGSQETIHDGTAASDNGSSIVIAVNRADIPFVAWSQNFGGNSTDRGIYTSDRSTGSWSARLLQTPASVGQVHNSSSIAIDSNNYIYVVWRGDSSTTIKYIKYTSFWTSPIQLSNVSIGSDAEPHLAIDSSDNVHVVWRNTNAAIRYVKYTFSTDLWGSEATVTVGASLPVYPTIAVDASNNLNVVFHTDIANPGDIYFVQNTGSWGADTNLLNASTPDSFSNPQIQSTIHPLIGAIRTNIATTGYQFTYINTVAGVNILRFYSSTDIAFPSSQTQNYSREANTSLPTTDNNLSSLFTATGYSNVADDDNVYEVQNATDKRAIFEFKNRGVVSTDVIHVSVLAKSNIAPSTSVVTLQSYNQSSSTWTTFDSNSVASANVEFAMVGSVLTGTSSFYSGGLWNSWRVHQ